MTSRANSSPLKKFFARRKTVEQAPEPREKDSSGVEALLRKVKRIDIISNRIANDMFSGQYRSAFRGQGIEFDEVREYTEGDDVRTIDWNVTARSNKPYVKRFSLRNGNADPSCRRFG